MELSQTAEEDYEDEIYAYNVRTDEDCRYAVKQFNRKRLTHTHTHALFRTPFDIRCLSNPALVHYAKDMELQLKVLFPEKMDEGNSLIAPFVGVAFVDSFDPENGKKFIENFQKDAFTEYDRLIIVRLAHVSLPDAQKMYGSPIDAFVHRIRQCPETIGECLGPDRRSAGYSLKSMVTTLLFPIDTVTKAYLPGFDSHVNFLCYALTTTDFSEDKFSPRVVSQWARDAPSLNYFAQSLAKTRYAPGVSMESQFIG